MRYSPQIMGKLVGVKGDIAARIIECRKELKLSQVALGKLIGVERMTVSHWECGRQTPTMYLHALAKALDVSAEWLRTGEGTPERTAQEEVNNLLRMFRENAQQSADKIAGKISLTPIEKLPQRSRREELPVYTLTVDSKAGHIPIPKWLDLAAGQGEDLALSEEYYYLREIPDWKHVHSAQIRGDSMEQTLLPGDIVLMREFPSGKLELPALEQDDPKNSLRRVKVEIADDWLYVLSVDDAPPTVKRVRYDVSNGEHNWQMLIIPDNNHYPPRAITRRNKVVFFAKLLGLGEGKFTKRRV